MTHITINSLSHGWNFGFFIDRIEAIRTAFSDRHDHRQAFRTVRAELDQFSAEEIVELGISQADIAFIADDAARR